MTTLIEKRNTIYGICAIWIVLFHIFRRIGMPYIPVITNTIAIGNMAVDVFFFFSGLCLSLSVKKHNYPNTGWRVYFGRRFIRVLVPYFIICIPYYLWNAVFEVKGNTSHKLIMFFANLSSVSFWLKGTETTWYLYGIVLFYLLFPLLYMCLTKIGQGERFFLLAGFIIFAVITAYIPILKNSMILWARLPIFSIGIMMGIEKEKIWEPKRNELTILSIMLIVLGAITSISEISETITIPKVYRFLLYMPMTLVLLLLLSKIRHKIAVFESIGRISLELYLSHITLLHPLKHYGAMDAVGYWLYLILPVISIILAFIVRRIEQLLQSKVAL